MKTNLQASEYELGDNSPIRLENARGISIECTAGTIWITLSGEAEDIFLQAGERWSISSNGLALIESIGTGRIHLENPSKSAIARLGRSLNRLCRSTFVQLGNI